MANKIPVKESLVEHGTVNGIDNPDNNSALERSLYDINSDFFWRTLESLRQNLDVLISMNAKATHMCHYFKTDVEKAGWKKGTQMEFEGINAQKLFVTLQTELEKKAGQNKSKYASVINLMSRVCRNVGLKFNIQGRYGQKHVVQGFIESTCDCWIRETTFEEFVPEGVDHLVPLICIANAFICEANRLFTDLLAMAVMQQVVKIESMKVLNSELSSTLIEEDEQVQDKFDPETPTTVDAKIRRSVVVRLMRKKTRSSLFNKKSFDESFY